MDTLKTKESQADVLQIIRNYTCQNRLLYPQKLSVTIGGENNTLHDKIKFNQDLYTKAAMLKEKKSNQKRLTTEKRENE